MKNNNYFQAKPMQRWFFGNAEFEQAFEASEIADVMEEVDNELFQLLDNLFQEINHLV